MAEYVGKGVKVKVDLNGVGGVSANWQSIGQQTDDGLDRTSDATEATHKDSGGWKKSIITLNSWSLSADIMLDGADAVYAFLKSKWRAQTMVYVQLDATAIGGSKEEGQAILSKLSEKFPVTGTVTATAQFDGNGALTISP